MASDVADDRKVVYQFLGRSGIKVSNVSLGCMTFGASVWAVPGQCDEDLSHQIINRFVGMGGNFFDTADIYGNGASEDIIGKWLETQEREKFVIATKCGGCLGKRHINNRGLSRRHVTEAIDDSLRRLRTDYIDLYQSHFWDNATPLAETLRTFDDLIRSGKARYLGVSNVTGWQMQQIMDTSRKLGLNPITTLQQQYNLLSRESELEPFQVCKSEGIGVLPWSPLKGGMLTGKIQRGETPLEGRVGYMVKTAPFLVDLSDRAFNVLDTLKSVAAAKGRSVSQVALRWLLQKDIVSSVIIGARTLSQLEDNMGAANGWRLSEDEMKELDDVSSTKLRYPYEGIFWNNKDRGNCFVNDHYVKSVF